ncbi:MAG: helix-turn-helix transcriptional regulator [Acidimicrobiales bacterium]
MPTPAATSTRSWTFLTNHAHVLLVISLDPEIRQREIADAVGITLGAAQRIVHDLEEAGYLASERIGRRNRYQLAGDLPLRHPLEQDRTVTDLLSALHSSDSSVE